MQSCWQKQLQSQLIKKNEAVSITQTQTDYRDLDYLEGILLARIPKQISRSRKR